MLISIPATSANLGPGFDTLGLAINFRNKILIKPAKYFSSNIKGEGADSYKIRKNILFFKIFYYYFYKLTECRENFSFDFTNKIPISRGLGSSSAVITGAISSAYAMADIPIEKKIVLDLALEYEKHPDNITSTVMGGFNVSCIENGKVYSKKFDIPSYLKAVIVIPNRSISTNKSRKSLSKVFSSEEVIYSLSRSSFMTAIFATGSWEELRVASKDMLHQTARMNAVPELFDIQNISLENGALMSTLSGSGSSFLTLCYEEDSFRIFTKLRNSFPKFRVLLSSLTNYGIIFKS